MRHRSPVRHEPAARYPSPTRQPAPPLALLLQRQQPTGLAARLQPQQRPQLSRHSEFPALSSAAAPLPGGQYLEAQPKAARDPIAEALESMKVSISGRLPPADLPPLDAGGPPARTPSAAGGNGSSVCNSVGNYRYTCALPGGTYP